MEAKANYASFTTVGALGGHLNRPPEPESLLTVLAQALETVGKCERAAESIGQKICPTPEKNTEGNSVSSGLNSLAFDLRSRAMRLADALDRINETL